MMWSRLTIPYLLVTSTDLDQQLSLPKSCLLQFTAGRPCPFRQTQVGNCKVLIISLESKGKGEKRITQ